MLTCCFFLSKDFKGVFKPHIRKIHFTTHKRLVIAQQQSAVKLNTEEELMSRNTSGSFPEIYVQLGYFCFLSSLIRQLPLCVPEIKNEITAQ